MCSAASTGRRPADLFAAVVGTVPAHRGSPGGGGGGIGGDGLGGLGLGLHTHTHTETSNGSVRSNVSINSGVWMAADSGDAFRFYVFYIKHWPWAVAAMCNLFYVAARDTVRVDFGVPGRRGTASVAKAVVGSDVLVPGEHGARFVRGARILAVFDAAEVAKLYCVEANCIHRMYACSRQQGACTGTKGRLSTSKYTLVQYCCRRQKGGWDYLQELHPRRQQPTISPFVQQCLHWKLPKTQVQMQLGPPSSYISFLVEADGRREKKKEIFRFRYYYTIISKLLFLHTMG